MLRQQEGASRIVGGWLPITILVAVACLFLIPTSARSDADRTATVAARPSKGQDAMNETPFKARTLYAPGHFGNSYEVMGEREMRDMLAEAAFWGFNRYADWFDTIDCSDPFAEPRFVNLGHAMWDRKKTNFRSAQSLGLACELVITPNHVYVDQCLPDLLAVKTSRIFGQLICPSKPKARDIILRNYENLFADLARAGVRLDAICFGPYDYGGCACDECKPWILTFAKLSREIHAIAERHHPGVEAHFIGWWWSEEEHRLFADWADREAPGWVKSIALHIPYGKTTVSGVPLPRGCERRAFVHIGYADKANPRDVYGHLGPVIAASRLQRTVADLRAAGCAGVMAYSEGVFDDVNKAILAGLTSGKFESSEDVLRAYAQRYFGADEDAARKWADWLAAMGKPFDLDADAAAEALGKLSSAPPNAAWRRRQWEMKAELLRLNAEIMKGKEWTPERLAAVDRFWAAQEKLYREVWGLGTLRHVFARRYTPLPWYSDWAKHAAERAHALGEEQ